MENHPLDITFPGSYWTLVPDMYKNIVNLTDFLNFYSFLNQISEIKIFDYQCESKKTYLLIK